MCSSIGAIVLISGIVVWSRHRNLSFSGDSVFIVSPDAGKQGTDLSLPAPEIHHLGQCHCRDDLLAENVDPRYRGMLTAAPIITILASLFTWSETGRQCERLALKILLHKPSLPDFTSTSDVRIHPSDPKTALPFHFRQHQIIRQAIGHLKASLAYIYEPVLCRIPQNGAHSEVSQNMCAGIQQFVLEWGP